MQTSPLRTLSPPVPPHRSTNATASVTATASSEGSEGTEAGLAPALEPLPAPLPSPSHRCHLCSRTYERADHLSRHMKSHENARPHKCSQCPKRFNRADLLNRHEASHNGQSSKRTDDNERVSIACIACVQSKCKCQDQKPCARCLRKSIQCQVAGTSYDAGSRSPRLNSPRLSSNGKVDIQNQAAFESTTDHQLQSYPDQLGHSRAPSGEVLPQGNYLISLAQSNSVPKSVYGNEVSMSMNNDLSLLNDSVPQYAQAEGDFQFNHAHDDMGFLPRDMYFGQDLDFAMWDVDLTTFEIPPTYVNSDPPVTQDKNQASGEAPIEKVHASKRYAAFKRSPWLWNPTTEDHSLNDQTNLNVDEDSTSLALTPHTPVATLDQFAHCSIDSNVRDQLLHLLFDVRVNNAPVKFFPPLKLINLIISVYFVRSRMAVDHIIHAPTFNPRTALLQLLLSIISAGASSVSAPVIWKMGLALQEFIRHTVSDLWERNNVQSRNLQAIQAWMIGLDVGLWSGIKRKMEIAESSCQPIIIILRRAGIFSARKGSIAASKPTPEDAEDLLQTKWAKFAERESFKRLALHLFVHDAQASMSFQKPPQISFTEIQVDLPVSRDLWLADSASEWRSEFLKKQAGGLPNFMEVLRNPEVLNEVSGQVDVKLSCTIALLGYWGQLWRLIEAQKFYPSSRSAYRLSFMTESDELYRDIHATATKTSQLCHSDPPIDILGNLLMMFLHVTPEDLQRFAGKYGADESREASAAFETWCLATHSRNAIWHAGQVLRAAKNMMATQLRDFYAVAVYYASLTLWVYGTITRLRDEARTANFPSNTPISNYTGRSQTHVYLNREELASTVKFRDTSEGIPGIALFDGDQLLEFAPLTSTNRILHIARCLFRTNFPVYDEPLPPLVESLGNLMRDLCSSPGSRASRAVSEIP